MNTSEWQPIETAPRDGTHIYLCGGHLYGECQGDKAYLVCIAAYHPLNAPEYEWQLPHWDRWQQWAVEPSHWMPLPAPPPQSDSKTKTAGVHPPARVTHLGAE